MAAFAELPAGEGFRLLDRALRTDIRAVPEAPRSLHALFADLERVPSWVDWPRLDRGGAVVLRAGAAAGIVLGMKSLILGYASPGGNKPLVFSGRLQEQASRRLAETCRFVQAVSRPRGMYRHGEGFAITLKVRLMHAQVRRLIQRSGRWRPDSWGHPVNQHDMLATVILFSAALIEGLRQLGYGVTPEEAEDVIHLWRYAGRVIGVEDALLPRSFSEAMEVAHLIRESQGEPDDDARALVQALFDARLAVLRGQGGIVNRWTAARRIGVMHAVCRRLIGDRSADALGIGRSPLGALAGLVRPAARLAAHMNRLPLWRTLAETLGDRYWDAAVAEGLGGTPATYHPPPALAGG
jgi:ER-bound oxygenase mpaB/B'/Rubber oxygenase, catalytic domain